MDREGKRAVLFIGFKSREGIEVSMEVGNVEESGVLVVTPGCTVVEKPQCAIGREAGIGRTADFDREGKSSMPARFWFLSSRAHLMKGRFQSQKRRQLS